MARAGEDIRSRLLKTFRGEAQEHLQAIAASLASLERGLPVAEAAEVVETTFREIHTLKGAARSVSRLDVEGLCQACESVFSRVRRGDLALSQAALDAVQQAMDAVARLLEGGEAPPEARDLIARLEAVAEGEGVVGAVGEPPSQRAAGSVGPESRPVESVRLATSELDALFVQAEDLLVPKLAAGERIRDGQMLLAALTRWRAALAGDGKPETGAADPGAAAGLKAEMERELRALEVQAGDLVRQLTQDQRGLGGSVDALQAEMRRLRMTPASAVLDLLPWMVRDLAREQGKEVEWAAHGADLEVDRRVLDAIKDPLIHLVRNSVGHGIERPEERARAGKPPHGRITVTVASREGNRIAIEVDDDGAGIDPANVRAAAARSHLLAPETAETLPEDASLALIFQSGLSTSPIITELSGHGLGLAIVKERVEGLGGQVDVDTRVGVGTTVRIEVPASIATFRGLLVGAGQQQFLLPLETVERCVRIAPGEVESVEGRDALLWEGHPVLIEQLSTLLGLPSRSDGQPSAAPHATAQPSPTPSRGGSHQLCVITKVGDERVGLVVEDIVGDQEVLAKELTAPLVRVPNVAGAGLLGTGQVVLILRPRDLVRAIRDQRPSRPASVPVARERHPAILVVDDSITTRTMEKNLLEAEGYQVRVGVDGIDAWTILKTEEFDLVLSDVDMPRMDGFDLTARIRADDKLAELPVVLVTALESREDKERGIAVGANAYVVKSSFDRSNLLAIIRRML